MVIASTKVEQQHWHLLGDTNSFNFALKEHTAEWSPNIVSTPRVVRGWPVIRCRATRKEERTWKERYQDVAYTYIPGPSKGGQWRATSSQGVSDQILSAVLQPASPSPGWNQNEPTVQQDRDEPFIEQQRSLCDRCWMPPHAERGPRDLSGLREPRPTRLRSPETTQRGACRNAAFQACGQESTRSKLDEGQLRQTVK